MSHGENSWPFDDELLKQIDLFEQLKRESSKLIMEDGDALAFMASDISEALGRGPKDVDEQSYNALCEQFLTHAIQLSMGKIVPVLLRLLKEEDMDFLGQLSDRCPPNWIQTNKEREKRLVH